MLDMDQLALIPKSVRPIDAQDEQESRKLWDPVTKVGRSVAVADPKNLLAKNWGEATKQKQIIEQKQRDMAAQRKANNEE